MLLIKNNFLFKLLNRIFPSKEFEQFEVAQLVNLSCDNAEEAKALIPR